MIQATSLPHLIEYVEDDGLVCSLCELRVYKLVKSHPATCRQCKSRTMTTYQEITNFNMNNYPLQNHAPARGAKTLLFMCARKSSLTNKLSPDYFIKLKDSVELSES